MVVGCKFPRKQPLLHAQGVPLAKEVVEPSRNKYAVLVGINYYDDERSRLGGCINDAMNQLKMLTENFGFERHNIRLVTDAPENKGTDNYPTSRNIKAAISWLVSTCQAGDLSAPPRAAPRRTSAVVRARP